MMKPTVISGKNSVFSFRELLAYRELFLMLSWRDFRVRYAQTFIGLLWAVIQPLITISVLYLVFGRFVKIDTGDLPAIVYIACGTLAWSYFSYVMTNSGNSIIVAQAMVKKVYFPRIIIPLSKAITGLIDFFMLLIILVLLMLFLKVPVSSNVIYFPLFLILDIIAALGVGIWLSSLTIRFRDVQYIIPFLVQLGLYITPVAYPAQFAIERLPKWAAFIYFINPMAGIVEGFRWSILGTEPPSSMSIVSFVSIILLFISSLFYFKKIDGQIADLI